MAFLIPALFAQVQKELVCAAEKSKAGKFPFVGGGADEGVGDGGGFGGADDDFGGGGGGAAATQHYAWVSTKIRQRAVYDQQSVEPGREVRLTGLTRE